MEGLTMKYFVLKPEGKSKEDVYAAASRKAMKAYSDYIRPTNEQLANELWSWANRESLRHLEHSPTLTSDEK